MKQQVEPTDFYVLIDWLSECIDKSESPFDRLVVALDVDGFPISRDALVWTPLFEESEIVFCTVIS